MIRKADARRPRRRDLYDMPPWLTLSTLWALFRQAGAGELCRALGWRLRDIGLSAFGFVRVRHYLGRWSVDAEGQLVRRSIPLGWRIVRKSRALPDGATALDYWAAGHARRGDD